MKYVFLFLSLVLLASCQSEAAKEQKKEAKHQEVLAASAVVFPDLPQSMEFAGTKIDLRDEGLARSLLPGTG